MNFFINMPKKKDFWLFPEDVPVDTSERELAEEITREQLYLKLHQEIPYSAHIMTDDWEEKGENEVVINQSIVVLRESQKAIILSKIKEISRAARLEISKILDLKVHLYITVRLDEKWIENLK